VLENEIKYEGERQARAIRDTADLEAGKLLAEAEGQATRIRGEGEKLAAPSYNVFKQDPELAKFLLKLNGLELFLKERTTLILDPNTSPLELLNGTPTLETPNPRIVLPEKDSEGKPTEPAGKSAPVGQIPRNP